MSAAKKPRKAEVGKSLKKFQVVTPAPAASGAGEMALIVSEGRFSEDYGKIKIGNDIYHLVNFKTREMPSGHYINIKYELMWGPVQAVFNLDVEGGNARSALEKLHALLSPLRIQKPQQPPAPGTFVPDRSLPA
jgi:hypothetical protein